MRALELLELEIENTTDVFEAIIIHPTFYARLKSELNDIQSAKSTIADRLTVQGNEMTYDRYVPIYVSWFHVKPEEIKIY